MQDKNKLVLGAGKKPKQIGEHSDPEPTKAAAAAPEPVKPKNPNSPAATQAFTLKGVTHSKYPFKDLTVGQKVVLVPDPYGQSVKPEEGHSDAGAVSCQDTNGRHIGYIDKTVAQVISKALQSGKFTHEGNVVEVKGGYKSQSGEKLNWGVDILVRFYQI